MSSLSINAAPALLPPAQVEALRGIAVSHLSDNLQRLSGMGGLRRFHRSARLAGTAFTVKVRPGDNLLIYKALTMMSPGHVLVVDGAGDAANALVGELILRYAQRHGCVGFVIDGAVRDTAAFLEEDFPCYARTSIHRGPYKAGPGAINVPVAIDGQVVAPGDAIVGDEDGVLSFPAADAAALIAAAHRSAAFEADIKAEIANGQREQSWLTRMLQAHGL